MQPTPPPAAVRSELALSRLAEGPVPSSGPPQVVFTAPEGQAGAQAEIQVAFDKPMRALLTAPADPPSGGRIEPELAGHWEWVGTSAMRFVTPGGLPAATAVTVTVPAGMVAADGTRLAADHTFSFSTLRPALASSSPPSASHGVASDAPLELSFNLPVDPAEVARQLSIRAGGTSQKLPVTVARGEPADPQVVVVRPRPSWPRNESLAVRIAGALRSTAGPLPAGADALIELNTVGPVAVLGSSCSPDEAEPAHCAVARPLELRLSRYVSPDELQRAVTITPAVDFYLHPQGFGAGQEQAYNIHGPFEPARSYLVSVRRADRAGVIEFDGEPLSRGHHRRFRFGDRPATVGWSGGGVYWPAAKPLHVPLRATNVTDLELSGALLSDEQVMAQLALSDDGPVGVGIGFGAATSLPPPPRNDTRRHSVPVTQLLGPAARGPVLLRARYRALARGSSPTEHKSTTQSLQLTELGLLSHTSPSQVHLWVTGLSSGRPIGGAYVELRRVGEGSKVIARGRTNASGLATLPLAVPAARSAATPGAGDKRVVAFVRTADDRAHLVIEPGRSARSIGVVFTERGLYRRGETVHLKSIVRTPAASGLTTPKGQPVSLWVTDPRGREIARFTPRLSRFGTTSRSVRLPEDAPLGRYRATVQLGKGSFRTGFLVADYEPAAFTVKTRTDRATYVRGDTVTCLSSGRYLYGGPMAGAGVRVELSRSPTSHRLENLPEHFVIGDRVGSYRSTRPVRTQGKFDRLGRHRISHRLVLPEMGPPERVSCDVFAADLDHRTLAASGSAVVHPGDRYVALRGAVETVASGDPFRTEVLAVDLRGRRQVMPVTVRLHDRTLWPSGEVRSDRVLARCDVRTGSAPMPCTFETPPGDYRFGQHFLLVRATARDTRGHSISTSFRVVPEPPPPPPAQPVATPPPAPTPMPTPVAARRDLRVHVSSPHQAAQMGSTLKVAIESPWRQVASALVSVMGEDVLWQRRIRLPPAGAKLAVPVTAGFIPNGQVRVTALRGLRSRHSEAYFAVSAESRKLHVELEPAKTIARPGEALELAVRVRDARGKPVRAEVTLFGADEGTLYLANYRTPEPFEWMFEERSHDIRTRDARQMLFAPLRRSHRARPPRVRMGASSISDSVRHDFRQTVLYEPALTTDRTGRLRHQVVLPDGLSTYRFMAVAVAADDRFGSAESKVQTRKPLMVRATLPSVIRAGDRFRVVAVLAATKRQARLVRLRITARGLRVHGSSHRDVRTKPGQPARHSFELSAPQVGSYQVVVRARSAGGKPVLGDALRLSGRVERPAPSETAALHGSTRSAVAEALGSLSRLRRDVGELTITLAKTRLIGLDAGLEQLLEYPYGCTEQTASRLLPLVSLAGLARAIGTTLPVDRNRWIEGAVRRLQSHQRADGGFGLWPESLHSEAWLTAWTLRALVAAGAVGSSVPRPMVARAKRWLLAWLEPLQPSPPGADRSAPKMALANERDRVIAALVVDVLAETSADVTAAMERLYAERSGLPLAGKALLLHALARGGQGAQRSAVATLVGELTAALDVSGRVARLRPAATATASWRGAIMASDVRATALILRALNRAAPDDPRVPMLATGLLELRQGGRWSSTQDTAWALLALDAHRRSQSQEPRRFAARVFLDDELVGDVRFAPGSPLQRSFTLPMRALHGHRGKLTFQVRGTGQLHYQARLDFARRQLPTKPLTAGLYVHKTMRRVTDFASERGAAPPPSTRFRPGELVAVEVTVVATSPKHFVVVDDPLPGGLEAVEPQLRTGVVESGSRSWDRRELRDDRALFFVDHLPAGVWSFRYYARARTPGRFALPPTQAFEMYAPDVRGRTAASAVTVAQ